jgi:hypothetical protein
MVNEPDLGGNCFPDFQTEFAPGVLFYDTNGGPQTKKLASILLILDWRSCIFFWN